MTADYLGLKIGGSLFSDKSREDSLDHQALAAYAGLVGSLARRRPGRVVLITGGGGIGHGAIRGQSGRSARSLIGLARATFSVRWAWTEALAGAGVAALPLQLSAMCTIRDGRPQMSAGVITDCLAAGLLPVLSGDCLLTDQGGLSAFSSDRVPEVLLAALPGSVRVVMLTDVPGVLVGGPHGTEVLREIDACRPGPAYDLLWQQSEWDVTGAMRAKLDALVTCARGGAECYIMRGDPHCGDLTHLLDDVAGWPPGLQYTRVAEGTRR